MLCGAVTSTFVVLTDFKLGTGVSVKVENNWRGVGRPQVAMHRNNASFYRAALNADAV